MDDNNNKTRASLRRTNSYRRFSGINTTQTKISTNDVRSSQYCTQFLSILFLADIH